MAVYMSTILKKEGAHLLRSMTSTPRSLRGQRSYLPRAAGKVLERFIEPTFSKRHSNQKRYRGITLLLQPTWQIWTKMPQSGFKSQHPALQLFKCHIPATSVMHALYTEISVTLVPAARNAAVCRAVPIKIQQK